MKPEEACEQFNAKINTASDDELCQILTQKCSFAELMGEPEGSPNTEFSIIEYEDELDGSPLETQFILLVRLAFGCKPKTFNLVLDTYIKWYSDGLIPIPNGKIYALQYSEYFLGEEPLYWKARIESGKEIDSKPPAWSHDEDGYVEAYAGSLGNMVGIGEEASCRLDCLTYERLKECTKKIGAFYEICMDLDSLDENSKARFSPCDANPCSSDEFGNRSKDPSKFTLIIE